MEKAWLGTEKEEEKRKYKGNVKRKVWLVTLIINNKLKIGRV